MIIPERCVCDFCGKENPEYMGICLPVKTDCDWTEGYATQQRIETEEYDICKECLLKATNIFAGFQGSNPRIMFNGEAIRRTGNG